MLLNFCATPDSVSVLYSMISRSVESEADNHVPHQTGTHVEEHFSVDPSNRYCLPEFEPILHSSDQLIYIKRCRLQSKRLRHVSPGITYVLSNASNHPNANLGRWQLRASSPTDLLQTGRRCMARIREVGIDSRWSEIRSHAGPVRRNGFICLLRHS